MPRGDWLREAGNIQLGPLPTMYKVPTPHGIVEFTLPEGVTSDDFYAAAYYLREMLRKKEETVKTTAKEHERLGG